MQQNMLPYNRYKPFENTAVQRACRRIDKMPINLEKFKQRILADKARLEADKARISEHGNNAQDVGELVDYDMNHPGDAGANLMEREKDEAFVENITGILATMNDALAKIEKGTFGKCDRCNKSISEARLEVIPYAVLCIDCQSRAEGS
jgi:RNA polymerase-binding transcription factor DksA